MDRCPVCNGPLESTDAVCPACGFKLSGATHEFQPISIGADGKPQAPLAQRSPRTLTVVRGPGQIDTVYTLERREMTVGRSPQCDIFLNDMTVSHDHATLQPVGEDFAICDAESFNGVWINNENVSQAVLADGDLVQIGAFVLEYRQ